jgi:tRNA (cytidine/uridine-2'-O-)-methyltransferase
MLHLGLFQPEIPPNTGNVARLCAATGSRLHLIGRLGFSLADKHLKRAGLDYWPSVDLVQHPDLDAFLASVGRVWVVENPAPRLFTQVRYADGDALLFGPESVGLPADVRERFATGTVSIPMPAGKVRSLNLSTAVGVAAYEALRQIHGW